MKKIVKPILLGVISSMALFGCQPKDVENKEKAQNEQSMSIPAEQAESITKNVEENKPLEASIDGINDFLDKNGVEGLTINDFKDLEYEETVNEEGSKIYTYKLKDGEMTLTSTKEDKDGSFTLFELRDTEGKGFTLNIKTHEVSNVNIGEESENENKNTEENESSEEKLGGDENEEGR